MAAAAEAYESAGGSRGLSAPRRGACGCGARSWVAAGQMRIERCRSTNASSPSIPDETIAAADRIPVGRAEASGVIRIALPQAHPERIRGVRARLVGLDITDSSENSCISAGSIGTAESPKGGVTLNWASSPVRSFTTDKIYYVKYGIWGRQRPGTTPAGTSAVETSTAPPVHGPLGPDFDLRSARRSTRAPARPGPGCSGRHGFVGRLSTAFVRHGTDHPPQGRFDTPRGGSSPVAPERPGSVLFDAVAASNRRMLRIRWLAGSTVLASRAACAIPASFQRLPLRPGSESDHVVRPASSRQHPSSSKVGSPLPARYFWAYLHPIRDFVPLMPSPTGLRAPEWLQARSLGQRRAGSGASTMPSDGSHALGPSRAGRAGALATSSG